MRFTRSILLLITCLTILFVVPLVRGQEATAKSGPVSSNIVIKNSIGMELVWIPAGTFMMGSTAAEVDKAFADCKKWDPLECRRENWFTAEMPKHLVTIPQRFLMGKYEVTQGQWQEVMGTNPSLNKECGVKCPVENVNWSSVQDFIKKLNARNDGYEYRLPSEAEWEYTCRAGTTTEFAFGNTLNSHQANFDGEHPYHSTKGPYLRKTVSVGSYKPNAWGLYDMHGNVQEWVQDIFDPNYKGVRADGLANESIGDPSLRVIRGGSWECFGHVLTSASRNMGEPENNNGNDDFGFRIAARIK